MTTAGPYNRDLLFFLAQSQIIIPSRAPKDEMDNLFPHHQRIVDQLDTARRLVTYVEPGIVLIQLSKLVAETCLIMGKIRDNVGVGVPQNTENNTRKAFDLIEEISKGVPHWDKIAAERTMQAELAIAYGAGRSRDSS